MVLRIYKEGSHENRPEKVALVVLSTIYVSDENFLYGRMIPRSGRYGFCIGTGYTGRKFRRNFGGPSWEEDVGGIEGL